MRRGSTAVNAGPAGDAATAATSTTPAGVERRVLSHIDIKAREWPGNLFLAACFARGNLGSFEPVFGGPTWRDGRSSLFADPPGRSDLILTPGYGVKTTPHKLVAKYRSGGRLAVWHGEQIYGPWAYDSKLRVNRLGEYTRHVDAHLVWGPEMGSLLQSRCRVPAEKIYLVGCPKFDVVRPPLWQRLPPADRKVLFVSDFLLADFSGADYERVASTHDWGDDMQERREHYREARRRLVDCIGAVARAAPEERIVVRVHPGERLHAYAALDDVPNVSLDPAKRTFPQALAEAKVVLQYTSTSHFETRVAGIPAYCLDLLGWRGDDVHQTYFPWITPDELLEDLPSVIQGTREMVSKQPIDDALSQFFSVEEGPALPRTLAAILTLTDQAGTPEWGPKDFATMAAYTAGHKAKELGARALLRSAQAGVGARLAARVHEAQRRYEEGPNRVTEADTAAQAEGMLETFPSYLDWVVDASRSHTRRQTAVGVTLTCPEYAS